MPHFGSLVVIAHSAKSPPAPVVSDMSGGLLSSQLLQFSARVRTTLDSCATGTKSVAEKSSCVESGDRGDCRSFGRHLHTGEVRAKVRTRVLDRFMRMYIRGDGHANVMEASRRSSLPEVRRGRDASLGGLVRRFVDYHLSVFLVLSALELRSRRGNSTDAQRTSFPPSSPQTTHHTLSVLPWPRDPRLVVQNDTSLG